MITSKNSIKCKKRKRSLASVFSFLRPFFASAVAVLSFCYFCVCYQLVDACCAGVFAPAQISA
jgi:hypothetical protein